MQTNELKIEIEDLSTVKKKLDITVPADVVSREFKTAYQAIRGTASIAGFRKGAAPMNILKARFSEHVQEDVAKKLIESAYPHALGSKSLVPVEMPKIELKTDRPEEGKDFSFALTVEINPAVEISESDYKGMMLTRRKVEVTDREIEEGLRKLRDVRAKFNDVDRPANAGDLILIDFEGFINGEPIKGSKSVDYPIILGDKTLLPGMDEALSGAQNGETKEARVKFPENYGDKGLAGKDSSFSITVKAVKEKAVPELNEEFAKSVGCDTLEALNKKVKEELTNVKETQEKERLKNEILDRLISKHPFEVPEALVNRYLSVILNKVIDGINQGTALPEDRNLTIEQLRDKYRGAAERHVREDIVLDTIAAKEKLEISEEEADKAIRHIAELRGASFEALKTRIKSEGAFDVIIDGMKHEKVFDIIMEGSVGAPVPPEGAIPGGFFDSIRAPK